MRKTDVILGTSVVIVHNILHLKLRKRAVCTLIAIISDNRLKMQGKKYCEAARLKLAQNMFSSIITTQRYKTEPSV